MSESLYAKYGGEKTVSALVQDFYRRILETESLVPYFADLDMSKLMDHQTKFLSMALGGPSEYTGRQLKEAHSKLDVTEGAFGEVATILQETLEDAGVLAEDVAAIMGIVGGTKGDIVAETSNDSATTEAVAPSDGQDDQEKSA